MSISPGMRLGPYDVVSTLGHGGMGAVYRARDSRLNRDVAIKVLLPAVVNDADRLARFRREAHALAALNQQHIAGIYGFEDGPPPFIVMEFVDGQTLAHRIAHGPMPLDEVLSIAKQMAEGLEAAHDAGFVHRDLKPANVKIRPDGTVKILDFGLAKAIVPAHTSANGTLSQSPTTTSPTTQTGVILGTAGYMSPEQARGRPVDKRADVWAFGAVLFEMLTGHRPFEGDDVSETIALILKGTIDWNALPPELPPAIARLLHRCLERDTHARLSDMAMVRLELRDAEREPAVAQGATLTTSAASSSRPRAVAGIVALTAALIGGAVVWQFRKPAETGTVPVRFSIQLPDGVQLMNVGQNPLAISPDGTHVAYIANQRLYVRALDQLEAVAVPGTEVGGGGGGGGSARVPFFSADGKFIGYWQQGQLRKIEVAGRTAIPICDSVWTPVSVFWGSDGRIVWSQVVKDSSTILEVSAAGGTPQELAVFQSGQRASSVQELPGDEWILFVLHASGTTPEQGRVMLLSRKTKEQRQLLAGVVNATYVAPASLVLGIGNSLRVQRFDVSHLTVAGTPVSVVENVATLFNSPVIVAAASPSGHLLYSPADPAPSQAIETQLMSVTRAGQATKMLDVAGVVWFPRFSPDGARVAYGISNSASLNEDSDLWVLDVTRGARTRITFKANNRFYPIWTRDGMRLTFSDGVADNNRVLSAPADGSGAVETLLDTGPRRYGTSWSPDGKVLALYQGGNSVTVGGRVASRDLWMMTRQDGKWTTTPFVQTPFQERGAIFSPSGKWVAYVSDKSGQNDIYARPYPGPGAEVTISVGGGQEPVWGPSGQELFYRHDGKLWVTKVSETVAALTVSQPVKLFDDPYRPDTTAAPGGVANYDVSPDSKYFVMVRELGSNHPSTPVRLTVVLNWTEELKRLLSAQ